MVAKFHNTRLGIQRELILLADVEVGDAVSVLSAAQNLDPASLASFKKASTQLQAAEATDVEADRITALNVARQFLVQGSSAIGTNLNYKIGEGSVMF